MKTNRQQMCYVTALSAAVIIAGCISSPKGPNTFEQMNALATAGFELKMADTPAKLERIQHLPQLQLAKIESKGRQVYVYADAQGCQCVYTGDEDAYRRLLYQARQHELGERSYWDQEQSNRRTYTYKGEPIHWGEAIIITGSDVNLEDLRGDD